MLGSLVPIVLSVGEKHSVHYIKHLSIENRLLLVLPGLLFTLQLRPNCLVTDKPHSYPLNGESD